MSLLARDRHRIISEALDQGLLDPDTAPIAAFIDWDSVRTGVDELLHAFPTHVPVSHCFAVKANSIPTVVSALVHMGLATEVASDGELAVALSTGIEPSRVVFDSPAKTRRELASALRLGVSINIDNFQEFERIRELKSHIDSTSQLGFRVNPQIGAGTIEEMSTASDYSKFGVALKTGTNREGLIQAYLENPWLNQLHCHVGSQGMSLDSMVTGAKLLSELATEINERVGRPQVHTLDIGGGLPVNFTSDQRTPTFTDYANLLAEHAPLLFSGEFTVKTEFGRSILAKHGLIASFVEYTKDAGDRRIAISHAGAQVATRTIFMPTAWPLRVEVLDSTGQPRDVEHTQQHDVAGPCCFSGDVVAHRIQLPRVEQGDILVFPDTGAYYPSNPFSYNSLAQPGVYGVTGHETFTVLRAPREDPSLFSPDWPLRLDQGGTNQPMAHAWPAALL
ncbi:diaminopimelate decarboxylase [Auritidibacter ignavus]|uniref:diaminopimelate decarboxylase n=1 Tax=Auritidibacter ignavus TaxID=678932 RepID=UPI0024BABDFC|nr:diaminopimelate decarboxylase [Auritidibacter ignavus]WHS35899.1 diaminopimelate decarboxylase [Auritidibacter ignavus]